MDPNFEIKRARDGRLAIVLSKNAARIFDDLFEDKPVDILAVISEEERKILIRIQLLNYKQDYAR
jgi:hypothetical protein